MPFLCARNRNLARRFMSVDIAGKGVHLGRLSKVSRKRQGKTSCNPFVAAQTRNALHEKRFQIIANHDLSVTRLPQALFGPSAAYDHMNQRIYAVWALAGSELAFEKSCKADLRNGFPRFGKRHGVHANTTYASGAAMRRFARTRRRRTRKDPRPLLSRKLVGGMAHRIPNSGNALPFVNDVWAVARKRIAWIGAGYLQVGATVHIGNRCSMGK